MARWDFTILLSEIHKADNAEFDFVENDKNNLYLSPLFLDDLQKVLRDLKGLKTARSIPVLLHPTSAFEQISESVVLKEDLRAFFNAIAQRIDKSGSDSVSIDRGSIFAEDLDGENDTQAIAAFLQLIENLRQLRSKLIQDEEPDDEEEISKPVDKKTQDQNATGSAVVSPRASSSGAGDQDQTSAQGEPSETLGQQPTQSASTPPTRVLNKLDRGYVAAAAQYALLKQLGIDPDSDLAKSLSPELEILNGMLLDQLNTLDLSKYDLDGQGRLTVTGKTRLMSDLVLKVHRDGAFEPLRERLNTLSVEDFGGEDKQKKVQEKAVTITAEQIATAAFPQGDESTQDTDQKIKNHYSRATDLEFKRQMLEIAASGQLLSDKTIEKILKDINNNKLNSLTSLDIETYLTTSDFGDLFTALSPAQRMIIAGKIADVAKAKRSAPTYSTQNTNKEDLDTQINNHLKSVGIDPATPAGIRAKKMIVSAALQGHSIHDLDRAYWYALSQKDDESIAPLRNEVEEQTALLRAEHREGTRDILDSLHQQLSSNSGVFLYRKSDDSEPPGQIFNNIRSVADELHHDQDDLFWYSTARDEIITNAYEEGWTPSTETESDDTAPLMRQGSRVNRFARHAIASRAKRKLAQKATTKVAKKAVLGVAKSSPTFVAIGAGGFLTGAALGQILAGLGHVAAVSLSSILSGTVGGIIGGFVTGGPAGAVIGGLIGGTAGAVGGEIGYQVFSAKSVSAAQAASQAANLTKGLGFPEAAADINKTLAQASSSMGEYGTKVASDLGTSFSQSYGFAGGITTGTTGLAFWSTTGSLALVAGTSMLTMSAILSTFTPDGDMTFLGSYSTDIFESRYIRVKKTPTPAKADLPAPISYSIEISKKEEGKGKNIILTDLTDEMSVVTKDDKEAITPEIPDEFLQELQALENKPLGDDEVIRLSFSLPDTKDDQYKDTLIRNDLNITYLVDGTEEDTGVRAQTCFGDCPISAVPPCWPAAGRITQPPYSAGGGRPTRYCIDNPKHSHCGGYSSTYLPDAYDIGAVNGTPIYAVFDGVVDAINWHTDLGNVVRVDHGSFMSLYAHMNSKPTFKIGEKITRGQLIGGVGTSGNSEGFHLHYEVDGLPDFVLIKTLGVNTGGGKESTDITCKDYWDN